VQHEERPEAWIAYVVTAHHVIDGQPYPELVFPDPAVPGALYPPVSTSGPDWRQPIDGLDVAVLPFVRPHGYDLNALRAGEHLLEHLPAEMMLALPFHYVGLLAPVDRAMARSGTLGAVYQSDIRHGEDGFYEYEAHLGDCRSYGGFSGSPCFIELALPSLTPREPPIEAPPGLGPLGRIHYIHLLCGMLTWHLEPSGARTEASLYGVVAMATSDEIWRVLKAPELVEARRTMDAG
jgi:hypothetical protein